MTISVLIRLKRQERGLSMRMLAERAGLSWMTVWRLENEVNEPTLPTLRKLSSPLGIPLIDLVDSIERD